MKRNYGLDFYDLVAKCFTHIDEKEIGKFNSMQAKRAILRLWEQDPLTIESILIDQEVVRKRMLERLDIYKLDKFIEKQNKRGWSFREIENSILLYCFLLRADEYREFFDDDRNFKVILD